MNGVFVVPKGDGLRLIVNAIPSNTHFVDPPAVQLPTPDVLAALQADPSRPLYIGKMDLDNFYHRLRLPEWMWPYFALPPVRASDVGLEGDDLVYPCCITLPMGWTHSVGVAQAAHEHQIQLSGCFEPTDHITADSDPMLDRTRHGVYIDDTCVLTPDLADGEKGMQECQRHMESIGLPHKVSKFVQLTTDPVEVLGMEVSRDGMRRLSRSWRRSVARRWPWCRWARAQVGKWKSCSVNGLGL